MDFRSLLHHAVSLLMSARNVEEGLDCERDISSVVDHISVRDLGVGHVFPELLVLVSGHFTLLARPDCPQRVNNLSVKFDGERNKLREFLDGLLAERLLGELSAGRQ